MENKTKEEKEADLELADCMKESDIECMINEIMREEQEREDIYFEDRGCSQW